MTAAGIPMSATTSRPHRSQAGGRTCPCFGAPNATVRAALSRPRQEAAVRGEPRRDVHRDDGRLRRPASSTIATPTSPRGRASMPVPRSASTIRSPRPGQGAPPGALVGHLLHLGGAARRLIEGRHLHSGVPSHVLARAKRATRGRSLRSCRAATKPSPPLLPLPHSTRAGARPRMCTDRPRATAARRSPSARPRTARLLDGPPVGLPHLRRR